MGAQPAGVRRRDGEVDLVRDRRLVERFQAGDAQAFDELYRQYHRRLQRYCYRRVGSWDVAEEVVQEAFTRALSAMPTLGGDRRFYPWVSVIAGRLCVDHHRRSWRTEPAADPDPGAVDADQEVGLEAEAERALLGQAFDRLGPRHREVLELRELRGWSYQRIADHYAVSLGTIEALLFRARKALRREYDAVGGRVAGVVPLGLLGRRLARLRHWAGSRWAQVGPAGLDLASALVVCAGLSAMVPAGHGTSAPGVAAIPVAGARAFPAAQPLGPAPAPGVAAAPRSGSTAPSPTTAPRPSGTAPTRPLPLVVLGAGDAGRRWNAAQPVQVHGPLDVGADPAAFARLLTSPLARVPGRTAP